MGDLYFNGMYPLIDLGTGGSVEGMIRAADRALSFVDASTRIIPGHGPMSGRAELVAFRDMLTMVRDRIKPMVAGGKNLEQVIAAKPTRDFDEKWGKGFLKPEVFVEIVYTDLTSRMAPRRPKG
jgi:glyoxylase-like metal-dependent hydrolase (beta-lactamase superfamily II)